MGISFCVQECEGARVQASGGKLSDAVKLAELNNDGVRVKKHFRSVPFEIGMNFGVVKVFLIQRQKYRQSGFLMGQERQKRLQDQAIHFLEGGILDCQRK